MQEHGGQNGDPVVSGNNVGRDQSPPEHKVLAPRQLEHEAERVERDDRYGDDRKLALRAGGVGQGDHRSFSKRSKNPRAPRHAECRGG